jgi:hypothetical protein
MKTPQAVTAVPNLLGGRIDLAWRNPPATDFAGGPLLSKIRVVRRTRTFPLSETDGDIVYDGPVVTRATDSAALALTSWYYTVFTSDGAQFYADSGSQAVAFSTANYGLSDRLYRMLPAVHQRDDAALNSNDLANLAKMAPLAAAAYTALPPSVKALGQLQRFFRATFSSMDLMRSFAEGLRDIHDVELARPAYLAGLAQMVGWDLDRTLPVFAQRSEIRSAPGLYRTVGTVPNIRSLVTRYTGWYTQVAEFESQILRANIPAALNLFALSEGASGWTGFDDAAPALGFGGANNTATGTLAAAAVLVSTLAGPFPLRAGTEIAITADDRIPVAVRFNPGDFVSISSASAKEVAAVLNREFSELTASARNDGRLVLQSNTIGTTSSLKVEQAAATLVTLEGSPRGGISTCLDGAGRLRVFYEAADPAAIQAAAAGFLPPIAPPDAAGVLAFAPDTSFRTRALLASNSSQPFPLQPGMQLTITVGAASPVAVSIQARDFVNVAAATAAEVAAVLNAALAGSMVAAASSGRILLNPAPNSTATSIVVTGSLSGTPSAAASADAASTGPVADAAPALGFNPDFSFSSGTHATLTSPAAEPFPLRSGMQLTIAVDRTIPVTVVFRTAQFANIGVATAAEAAAAVNAAFAAPVASAQSGRLVLQSSAAGEAAGIRIFSAASGPPISSGRVRYKTFRGGTWGDSVPLLDPSAPTQSHPASVIQNNGKAWVAWVENADTAAARLRFTSEGASNPPQTARLSGHLTAPFSLVVGSGLIFRGNWPSLRGFEFAATDFANPRQASAAEVVTALNARLPGLLASVLPSGGLAIETAAAGSDQHLELVLPESTAAASLGFDATNSIAGGDSGDTINWLPAQDILPAPGNYRDLCAVVAADGTVFLFWAFHAAATWQIASARWNGSAWTAPEILASTQGGNREPCAVRDSTNRIWLFWSHREGAGTAADNWTLHRRIFDPGIALWSPESAVTSVPAGGAADREPGAQLAGGNLRVFFRSNRNGGQDIWSVIVNPAAGTASAPAQVTSDTAGNYTPVPVVLPAGASLLLLRSDRSVSMSRVAAHPVPAVENRITQPPPQPPPYSQPPSVRSADTGTLRRFAGAATVVLGDVNRNGRTRLFDDLLAYTPQKPMGAPVEILADDDLYTRGTIGLYLSQVIPDSELSRDLIDRLVPVLDRFLPVNVRAVVFLAPRAFVEDPIDLEDSFSDDFPFIEAAGGFTDAAAASMPGVDFLQSNTQGNVSANPADLTTLRRRSYFPPFE